MSNTEEDIKYDTGPTLLQMEEAVLQCEAPDRADGKRYLLLSGQLLPSLPDTTFGLCLTAETTQKEADALAELINKHCPAMFGLFYDRNLTDQYYEIGENGLAILEDPSQGR
jgi:hypothetical protein